MGDAYRVGSAVVQVTKPRSPCFKMGLKAGSQAFVGALAREPPSGFLPARPRGRRRRGRRRDRADLDGRRRADDRGGHRTAILRSVFGGGRERLDEDVEARPIRARDRRIRRPGARETPDSLLHRLAVEHERQAQVLREAAVRRGERAGNERRRRAAARPGRTRRHCRAAGEPRARGRPRAASTSIRADVFRGAS